ncbi:hypothetical protein Ancab_002281, partial [Ancistrocladus abbreviatus]
TVGGDFECCWASCCVRIWVSSILLSVFWLGRKGCWSLLVLLALCAAAADESYEDSLLCWFLLADLAGGGFRLFACI